MWRPPQAMFGRWTLKAVMFRGENLMDQLMTFETGQQYTNMQIIVSDKHTQIDLRVSGDDGQPTREYVALVFPLDKAKWNPQLRQVRTHVPDANYVDDQGGHHDDDHQPDGDTVVPVRVAGRVAGGCLLLWARSTWL